MPEAISENAKRPKVGLFVTCLVDLFRPNVGFSALELLEKAGCDVSVPDVQTCCGQPGYNSGDFTTAQSLARQVMAAFEEFDYVVGPSGSCMGMLREHYSELFPLEARGHRAKLFGERCYELTSFTDVMGLESVDVTYTGKVTYHDSCSSLREMGSKGNRVSCSKRLNLSIWLRWSKRRFVAVLVVPFALNTLRFPRGWRATR